MSHSWSLLQSSKECTNTLTLLISVSAFPSILFILRGMYQFNFFTPLTGVCVWSPQPDAIEPLYLCACVLPFSLNIHINNTKVLSAEHHSFYFIYVL